MSSIQPFRILATSTILLSLTNSFYSISSVSGDSMSPTLRPRDWLIVNKARWDDCKVGDVVLCRSVTEFPGRDIVKRVQDLDNAEGTVYLTSDNKDMKRMFEDSG
jgi:signal peptidase I